MAAVSTAACTSAPASIPVPLAVGPRVGDNSDGNDPTNGGKRVYIGNLAPTTHEAEIRAAFVGCGALLRVDMKHGFAFAEFEDHDKAKAAAAAIDGKEIGGRRAVVEVAKGSKSTLKQRRESGRGQWRVHIENLDSKTSWQDLKDFARAAAAGPISFTDVWMVEGTGKKAGIVEYLSASDMKEAVRKLNGTMLHGVEVAMYTSKREPGAPSSRSRSRSPRSRAGSRSGRHSHSRSRSRSHSSSKYRKHRRYSRRSRSRSRSRSPSHVSHSRHRTRRSRSGSKSRDSRELGGTPKPLAQPLGIPQPLRPRPCIGPVMRPGPWIREQGAAAPRSAALTARPTLFAVIDPNAPVVLPVSKLPPPPGVGAATWPRADSTIPKPPTPPHSITHTAVQPAVQPAVPPPFQLAVPAAAAVATGTPIAPIAPTTQPAPPMVMMMVNPSMMQAFNAWCMGMGMGMPNLTAVTAGAQSVIPINPAINPAITVASGNPAPPSHPPAVAGPLTVVRAQDNIRQRSETLIAQAAGAARPPTVRGPPLSMPTMLHSSTPATSMPRLERCV